MKSYFSYFRLKFLAGIQYRFDAIAGVSTQFVFGLAYVSIYIAFYKSNSVSTSISLKELISFVWLEQAFFALTYSFYRDKEIIKMIKNGNVAYELVRPQNLYLMWIFKIYGDKLSKVTLRFLPIIIIASLLKYPYKLYLSIDLKTFLLFIVTLFLASILVTLIAVLMHVICLYTLDDKGVVNIFMVFSDFLSGLVIPIPFFPKFLQKISNILPFRYVSDFPFRLYVGNISINDGLIGIVFQVIWIILLFIIGYKLMNKALKKAIIQGG